MSARITVYVFHCLLVMFFISGCTAFRISSKERSYLLALQILRAPSKSDAFDKIKACDDVDTLRIVAFTATAAAWPMEAGQDVKFDDIMDRMVIMALDRLFAIDSESSKESLKFYKRSFPPDGAYGLLFKEWEKRWGSLKSKGVDDSANMRSARTSPKSCQQ